MNTRARLPRTANLAAAALLCVAFGTAMIASALTLSSKDHASPDAVNRTAEALSRFQDLRVPGD